MFLTNARMPSKSSFLDLFHQEDPTLPQLRDKLIFAFGVCAVPVKRPDPVSISSSTKRANSETIAFNGATKLFS